MFKQYVSCGILWYQVPGGIVQQKQVLSKYLKLRGSLSFTCRQFELTIYVSHVKRFPKTK